MSEPGLARVERRLESHADLVRLIPLMSEAPSVNDAARELGVAPAQIVKALVLDAAGVTVLLLTPGDARLNNRKFQLRFGARPRFLSTIDTVRLTGHPIGGVGPFGLLTDVPTYSDIGLLQEEVVFTAAGSRSTIVQIAPSDLNEIADAQWVDVCR